MALMERIAKDEVLRSTVRALSRAFVAMCRQAMRVPQLPYRVADPAEFNNSIKNHQTNRSRPDKGNCIGADPCRRRTSRDLSCRIRELGDDENSTALKSLSF